MKVAVVVNTLKVGGMERVAVNLADAFQSQGHQTDLIYLKNRKVELKPNNLEIPVHLFDLKKDVFKTGIGALWFGACRLSNVLLRKTFPLFFAYAEAQAFKKRLNALEQESGQPFDLIVFRGHGTFEHIWPLADPRFVFACESVQPQEHYGKLSRWAFNKLYGNRHMVCISNGVMDNFQEMMQRYDIRPKDATLISNPVEFDYIAQYPDAGCDVLHSKPYILGLGRLNPVKNFPLLIRAYHHLVETKHIEQDLVIVGEGKERSSLEALVQELGLTERVSFKGLQTPSYPWFRHADVFVLSSKSEGLGMVLIEALACGAPIAATNCPGGVPHIMRGELSHYLSDMTPEALADKILLAMNTPKTESYQHDVELSLAQFDGENIVDTFVKTYSAK